MPTDEDGAALGVAFSAPLERSQAEPGPEPRDRIALREHVVEAEIGAFQAERGVRQRIRFDLVCEVVPGAEAVASDDVDGILSYDTLLDAVSEGLAAGRVDLLETLAERIAARVLTHQRAARVFVRVEKLDRGPFVLGVEIVLSRARAPRVPAPADAPPRPRVALVPADLGDAAFAARLEDLLAGNAPTILVAAPAFDAPRARHALAQRRIDLLAVEQAAWQLAARDPRCVVRASRTELDWALRRGEPSVWAPSRMVLDAAEAPADVEPWTLARWLGAAFDATEVLRVAP
jgi:dihydroneopterin aldolase